MSDLRIRLGSRTWGELGAAYDIENWTRPSDMPAILDYLPLGDYDQINPFEEIRQGFDYSLLGVGGINLNIDLLFSAGAMAQFRQDFLNADSATQFSGDLSASVTIRVPNTAYAVSVGEYAYIQCTMHFPLPANMRRLGSLWVVPLRFVDGTPAPQGADLSVEQVAGGAWSNGVANTITTTVSNGGDDSNINDVVVNYEIPARLDLTDTPTGTDWTVEYSDDNGFSYSPIEPTPVTDTTNLRFTYSNSVAAGDDAPNIVCELTPNATGSESSIIAVSMTDEYNTDNNSDTLAITIT